MRPLIICTLFCCFNSLTVSAQRYDFHVGLRLGCGISSNSNVQHILVSEEYYWLSGRLVGAMHKSLKV